MPHRSRPSGRPEISATFRSGIGTRLYAYTYFTTDRMLRERWDRAGPVSYGKRLRLGPGGAASRGGGGHRLELHDRAQPPARAADVEEQDPLHVAPAHETARVGLYGPAGVDRDQ